MVSGPASRPCPVRSVRSREIKATVDWGRAVGEVPGRLDRGSKAVSPSAS
jgi:hypothetical protein